MKLEGLKVIDLSLFLPGPLMTQMMADHGADVIKVEPINGGEPNRDIGANREGVSVFFANTHRGKRSLRLNLKADAGREALLRLCENADVLVEAFRPGVVKRLGVDYDSVRERAPQLVYASISAFGQDGPYVNRPAHDLATQAVAGILSVNCGPDDVPAIPGIANADMLSSMMALSGVLMALYRRHETGVGDYLDLAMMDSLIAAMPNNFGPVFAEKRPPVPKDERSWGGNAMYNIYQTSDGKHVVIGAAELHFARNVLERLGRPDLLSYCEPPPGPNQEPVREFLRETFRTRTQAEWIEWFDGVDCAFAPVNDLRQAADDPQVRHRQMVFEDERGWEHLGVPMKFAREPARPRLALPEFGEHSAEVLSEIGYSDADIATLRSNGVI
jgi:crotonobetainyl-CoA:carnitine CoA-transferase CaiB-like acyl-CoA transferase